MELQQRTDSWFRERAGKVTASVAGTVLGINSYQSPGDLWRQCKGLDPPFTGNYCTHWGNRNELNGLFEYMLITGLDSEHTGFWLHKDYYWLGASPDGLVGDNGLVEVKCPMSKTPWTLETIPLQYYAQIQVQMEVTNRDWCHLFAWRTQHQQLFSFKRNRKFFELIAPILMDFVKSMSRDVPPPTPDPRLKEHIRECMREDLMHWPHATVALPFSEFTGDGSIVRCHTAKRVCHNTPQKTRVSERDSAAEQEE
jgi:exodeoxyribonuclease (lambda-induced)